MTEQQAIELLRAAGYRVTAPRPGNKMLRITTLGLNAVGKPFSPSYDPRYRIKHKVSTAHLFKPYGDYVREHLTKWDA